MDFIIKLTDTNKDGVIAIREFVELFGDFFNMDEDQLRSMTSK